MFFGVLELMSLWLLGKDLFRPFLWSWHVRSLPEVITVNMVTLFIALIDIIIKFHSDRLGKIAKLPDNTVIKILNFGDRFEVVSLCLKESFCAPIVLRNLSDDLGSFGLKFALQKSDQ